MRSAIDLFLSLWANLFPEHYLACGQEPAGNIHSGVKISTRISPQVNDKFGAPACSEFFYRIFKQCVRLAAKVVKTDDKDIAREWEPQ